MPRRRLAPRRGRGRRAALGRLRGAASFPDEVAKPRGGGQGGRTPAVVQQLQRRRTQQEGRSVRVPSACDGDADGDRVVSDQVDLRAQVDDREGSLVASRPPPGAGLRVEPAVSRPWPSASPIAAGPTSRTGAGDCGVCAARAGVTCDGGQPSIRRLMVASAAAAARLRYCGQGNVTPWPCSLARDPPRAAAAASCHVSTHSLF